MSLSPFIDAANWVRGEVSDLINGEKTNDFVPVDPAEDPTRAAEAEADRIKAVVTTGAAAQINQSLINQAMAEQKQKQIWLLVGAGFVAYFLMTTGKPRKKKRK